MSSKAEFLSSRNGFMVNRAALRSGMLTHPQAIVLYALIDQFAYVVREKDNKLIDGEWFYFLGESALDWLGMSPRAFSRYVNALKKKGLIYVKWMCPPGHYDSKNFYSFNYKNIVEMEQAGQKRLKEVDRSDLRRWTEVTGNTKQRVTNHNKEKDILCKVGNGTTKSGCRSKWADKE